LAKRIPRPPQRLGQDRLRRQIRLQQEPATRTKRPPNRVQKPGVAGIVEVREAVAEAVGRVENLGPRQIAHIASRECRCDPAPPPRPRAAPRARAASPAARPPPVPPYPRAASSSACRPAPHGTSSTFRSPGRRAAPPDPPEPSASSRETMNSTSPAVTCGGKS